MMVTILSLNKKLMKVIQILLSKWFRMMVLSILTGVRIRMEIYLFQECAQLANSAKMDKFFRRHQEIKINAIAQNTWMMVTSVTHHVLKSADVQAQGMVAMPQNCFRPEDSNGK